MKHMKHTKKTILTFAFGLFSALSYGQWGTETLHSEFDGPIFFAYNYAEDLSAIKLYQSPEDIHPIFAVYSAPGKDFCDQITSADIILYKGADKQRFSMVVAKTSDNKAYAMAKYLWTPEFIKAFKEANRCLIRINQETCENDYLEFDMTGSTSAYNMFVKPVITKKKIR